MLKALSVSNDWLDGKTFWRGKRVRDADAQAGFGDTEGRGQEVREWNAFVRSLG